ncbi:MAG: sugar ABC transporter ATP-binding protein, partial [Verrucomicrobiae bacterium]|nr:sugar ABC transporter ATP-binding protein [Verrucomicrobiae bacterium]
MLQVRNLTKTFPGVRALDNVSLDVIAGTVHAVMGENGAGKSTLMKIVAGLEKPDSGEVHCNGRVAMIHQELTPFRELSVAENIFMGQHPTRGFGWVDKRAMRREAARLLQQLGVPLEPSRPVRTLGFAQMQIVEIAKALARRADLIIMDEPTSAISEREAGALFNIIAGLKQRGATIIYVSHNIEEVFRIADTVTVLRDGRHVATLPARQLDESKLIGLMVGREPAVAAVDAAAPSRGGEVALEVRHLTRRNKFRDVSFAVRRGEILGMAGLIGAG